MSNPPNASDANSETLSQLTDLQTTANNAFIAQSFIAINNAINEGKYAVTLTTFEYCYIPDLQTYYNGLGYRVEYPDLLNPNLSPWNPAELFGQSLIDYWNNGGPVETLTNPVRITLMWKTP